MKHERTRRFLLEPRAYLMDPVVLCMNTLARGAYSTLLMHLWDMPEPGVVVNDAVALAALARCTPAEWQVVQLQVAKAFDTDSRPGWWVQKRMVRVHLEQTRWLKGKTEAGRRGGKARVANALASSGQADLKLYSTGVGLGVGVGVGVDESKATDMATGGGRVDGQLALGKHTTQRAEWLEGFTEDFWPAYPRKVAKPRAVKAWLAIRPWAQSQLDAIMAGLQVWVDHWKDEGTPARLIPHPATWLNDRRWEDKP